MRRFAAVAAAATLSGAAAAQSPATYVRVDYQAPALCRTAGEFVGQVLDRCEHASLAPAEALARSFTVRIRKVHGEPAYAGELRFIDRNSRVVTRKLEGSSCNEVADALVLVTALAIEAQEPVEPEPEVVVLPQPLPPPPTKLDPSAAPMPMDLPPPPPAAPAVVESHPLSIDALLTADTFTSPRTAFGPEIGLGLGRSALLPATRFRLRYATAGTVTVPAEAPVVENQEARFDLLAAGLDVCPVGTNGTGVGVEGCVTGELGALRGKGRKSTEIDLPKASWQPWASLGLLGRLRADLFGPVFGQVQGEALVPLFRDSFYFSDPHIPAYDLPWVGFAAGLGVGWRSE